MVTAPYPKFPINCPPPEITPADELEQETPATLLHNKNILIYQPSNKLIILYKPFVGPFLIATFFSFPCKLFKKIKSLLIQTMIRL